MNLDEKVYDVEFGEAALRDLKKLPKQIQQKIITLARSLSSNPRPENIEPLVEYKGLYRVRTGNYRLVYSIEDDKLVVFVIAIGDRKNIYELVERRV